MKFKYTILYVKSVKETLEFYNHAFGFKTKFLHESEDYGELDTGETSLSFSSLELKRQLEKNPATADAKNPAFEIAFETDDVQSALKKALAAGAILVLIVLSGFFSGSETALTAVSRGRMKQLGKLGDKRASSVNALTENKERLIGALLIGNNLINVMSSALATTLLLKVFVME